MSQTAHEVIEMGNNAGTCRGSAQPVLSKFTNANEIDGDQTPIQPLRPPQARTQGESSSGDSSGPFFSIYSKAADEEDNKMVDRWQKDADGILIFVSPRVVICVFLCIKPNTMLDWSILRRSRCTSWSDHPRPEAK